jgi:hypothetical protein
MSLSLMRALLTLSFMWKFSGPFDRIYERVDYKILKFNWFHSPIFKQQKINPHLFSTKTIQIYIISFRQLKNYSKFSILSIFYQLTISLVHFYSTKKSSKISLTHYVLTPTSYSLSPEINSGSQLHHNIGTRFWSIPHKKNPITADSGQFRLVNT